MVFQFEPFGSRQNSDRIFPIFASDFKKTTRRFRNNGGLQSTNYSFVGYFLYPG